jgi:multicomponent Na+:H+ antiporter subunit C
LESLLAGLVGILFACGVYLVLRPNLLRFVFGIMLLSNAVNLLIFTAGRVAEGNPPLIPAGEVLPLAPFANPLPQALVLTAIVIGFGLVVFTLVLIHSGYEAVGSVEPDHVSREWPLEDADPGGEVLPVVAAAEARQRALERP